MNSNLTYTLDEVLKLRRVMNLCADRRPKWFSNSTGICHNLSTLYMHRPIHQLNPLQHIVLPDITGYFRTWEHFSGDLGYPIPSLSECLDAYHKYFSVAENLYDQCDPYCKLRYDLVDHIIKQMKAELK